MSPFYFWLYILFSSLSDELLQMQQRMLEIQQRLQQQIVIDMDNLPSTSPELKVASSLHIKSAHGTVNLSQSSMNLKSLVDVSSTLSNSTLPSI